MYVHLHDLCTCNASATTFCLACSSCVCMHHTCRIKPISSCRGLMTYAQSETRYLWKGLSCALGFFVVSSIIALSESLNYRVIANGAANASTVLTSAVYNKVGHANSP